jgi:hypothetical protein
MPHTHTLEHCQYGVVQGGCGEAVLVGSVQFECICHYMTHRNMMCVKYWCGVVWCGVKQELALGHLV